MIRCCKYWKNLHRFAWDKFNHNLSIDGGKHHTHKICMSIVFFLDCCAAFSDVEMKFHFHPQRSGCHATYEPVCRISPLDFLAGSNSSQTTIGGWYCVEIWGFGAPAMLSITLKGHWCAEKMENRGSWPFGLRASTAICSKREA